MAVYDHNEVADMGAAAVAGGSELPKAAPGKPPVNLENPFRIVITSG